MTNFERLKNMEEDEFAAEFMMFKPSDSCFDDENKNYVALDGSWHKHSQDCFQANLKWLNEEIEIDTNKWETQLDELCGEHILSAVEFGQSDDGQATLFYFTLDDTTYCIQEDPNDGYRSSMDSISIVDKKLRFGIPETKVECMLRHNEMSILDIYDCLTSKIIISIGTDYRDDYYPCFVAEWQPENLWCNAKSPKIDWISVKDRLPDKNERVLVHVVGKPFNMDADRFVNSRWVRWNGSVTHWMSLPEPPEGE